jgi:(R,R)-butanediol dehydrogenase/meso-butanediol dehydrogenase/diacetyl reductase
LAKKHPLQLGHEFTGVVYDIGSKVTKFNKGDRVVINPTVSNREKEENIDLYDGYSFIGLGSDG